MTEPDQQVRSEGQNPSSARPRLITNFSGYSPTFDVIWVASRMIAAVPSNYLFGLDAIVFSDIGSLSRKRQTSTTKSRKRKVKIGNTAGLYHGKWQGKPAWIELFVDQIIGDGNRQQWFVRIPFVRDIFLSGTLFHEIGHHIHATARPEFREKEDVADKWKLRLQRRYFKSRYPLMTAVLMMMRPLLETIIQNRSGKVRH